MIDLQSADSGLHKVRPNIDAVLNALLAFQITTFCPMLLLFFVGFYFLYVLNQLYIRMFGVKNSHLSPAWLKNPLLAEISQTSHSGHFLRIHLRNDLSIRCHCEKLKIGFFSQFCFEKSLYVWRSQE